jgi:hypothetical protein
MESKQPPQEKEERSLSDAFGQAVLAHQLGGKEALSSWLKESERLYPNEDLLQSREESAPPPVPEGPELDPELVSRYRQQAEAQDSEEAEESPEEQRAEGQQGEGLEVHRQQVLERRAFLQARLQAKGGSTTQDKES